MDFFFLFNLLSGLMIPVLSLRLPFTSVSSLSTRSQRKWQQFHQVVLSSPPMTITEVSHIVLIFVKGKDSRWALQFSPFFILYIYLFILSWGKLVVVSDLVTEVKCLHVCLPGRLGSNSSSSSCGSAEYTGEVIPHHPGRERNMDFVLKIFLKKKMCRPHGKKKER